MRLPVGPDCPRTATSRPKLHLLQTASTHMSITGEDPELNSSNISENHDLRSQFVEQLLVEDSMPCLAGSHPAPSRRIVQFWDDLSTIPEDVRACMDSWAPLEAAGYTREVFGDAEARCFIRHHFESRHLLAFERCGHPAMRSDYFRLCFMQRGGGLYVDADDVYQGVGLGHLFQDGLLKLQPLCYDIESDSMVAPAQAAARPQGRRIFYVNNNPIAAPAGHPVIVRALERATAALGAGEGGRDVQSLTGPGNLTASLIEHAVETERANLVISPYWLTGTLWP